ncbi:MAG: hypothetical protein NZ534_07925, partial [Bacteroidia bacterium]|nr:hypothetical protein [Bacteroidia bacterium]
MALLGATLNANAGSNMVFEGYGALDLGGNPNLAGAGIVAYKKGSTPSVVNIFGTATLNHIAGDGGGLIYFNDSHVNIKNGGQILSTSESGPSFYGVNGAVSGTLTVENGGTLELNASMSLTNVEAIASLSFFNVGSNIKLYSGTTPQARFLIAGQQYNNTIITNCGGGCENGWVIGDPNTGGTIYGNGTYYNLGFPAGIANYQTASTSDLKVAKKLSVGAAREFSINGTLTMLSGSDILNSGTIIVNETGSSGWLRLQNNIPPMSFPQGVEIWNGGLMTIEATVGFGNAPNRPDLQSGGKIRVGTGSNPGVLNAGGAFTVVNGASFEIMPDGIMNLGNQNFTVNAGGTFAIRSDASGGASRAGILMNTGTGAVIGDAIVERQFTGGQGYRYISPPTSGEAFNTISGFTPNAIQYTTTYPFVGSLGNFFWYDETLTNAYPWMSFDPNPGNPLLTWKKWIGWESSTNPATPLEVGRGYAIRTTSPVKISVTGPLNNGAVTGKTMTKQASTQNPNGTGWHLAGNPYPSPIQVSALLSHNSSRINGVCYRFEHTSLFYGQYNSHNGTMGTPASVPGTIAMFQAFFVEANGGGGALQFTNAMRTSSSTTFYRTAEPKDVLRLQLVAPNGLGDEILVYHQPSNEIEAGATPEFDPRWDGKELIPFEQNSPSFFSLAETGEKLSLNATSALDFNRKIQLGIDVPNAGEIRLKTIELNHFDPTAMVLLVDTKTQTFVNLRHTSEYVTYFDPATDRFRFHIQYYAPLTITKTNAACENGGGEIVVVAPDHVPGWFYALRDDQGM